jgi:hypothetical protein
MAGIFGAADILSMARILSTADILSTAPSRLSPISRGPISGADPSALALRRAPLPTARRAYSRSYG